MKMHANARLSLKGRELLIDRVENAGSATAPRASGSPATVPRAVTVYWIAPPHRGMWQTGLRNAGSR